jgi:neuronal guanine nucleotide exchange factor
VCRNTNAEFREKLEWLESDPKCQKLDLQSFLALPMQRVTRLPLLFDAIYKNLSEDDPSYQAVEQCLYTLHKVSFYIGSEVFILVYS